MSLFESLLINQTERQLSLLQEQSKNYHEWFKQDQSRVDQFLVQDCFAGGVVSDLWEGALARLYDNNIEIKGRWNSFSGVCADEGLHVSNRIIRCKETYSLKSLALEVKIDLKLLVNSQVWVVTRGQDVKDPAACILKISKESEVDGTFIVFGSPIGTDNEFIFFKRQQIPEEKIDPSQEFTNIDIKIKDNGDDRIFVSVKMDTLQSTVFQTYCNKFLPSFVENKLMIVGIGRNVILKKISVQQKERSSMGIIIEASKRQQCCQIF